MTTTWLFIVAFLSALCLSFNEETMAGIDAQSAPARLIVKFKNDSVAGLSKLSRRGASAMEEFNRLAGKYRFVESSKGFPEAAPDRFMSGVAVLTLPVASDAEQAADEIRALSNVEYVEQDFRMELFAAPNDPLYLQQWNLHNTGQRLLARTSQPRRQQRPNDTGNRDHGK